MFRVILSQGSDLEEVSLGTGTIMRLIINTTIFTIGMQL